MANASSDTVAPTRPRQLRVLFAGPTWISLSWKGSQDNNRIAGYRIFVNSVISGTTSRRTYTALGLACGRGYTIEVEAFDRAGNRSLRAAVMSATSACTDVTPPSPPTNLMQFDQRATEFTLAWSAASDAVGVVGYDVFRNGVKVGWTTQPRYTLAGLACATQYVVGVEAYDASGNRSPRASTMMTTAPCPDTSPPSAPGGLSQTSASASSVSLTWSASSDNVGVVGYGVYENGRLAGSPTTTSSTLSGLACGTTYTIGVDAYDAAGNRSVAVYVMAATSPCPDAQAPSAPTGLLQSGATDTSVTVTWKASTDNVGVAGYGVYQGGARVTSTTTTSQTLSGLSCGKAYTVGLDAYDAAGNRSAQVTLVASTSVCSSDAQPPSVPQGLTMTSATITSITLAWNPSTDNVGVAGYRLFRNGAAVGTTTQGTYTFAGLECAMTYTLAVEAYDAAGNVSNRAEATTLRSTTACASDTQPPSVPQGLTMSGATETSISLAWSASTDNVGVAGYRLFRDGTAVGTTPGTTYTFAGLACATSYTLAVEAYDAAGNVSNRAEATTPRSTTACPATQLPPPPGSDVAHLWVHAQAGGLCTRSTAPVTYDPVTACSGFGAAYSAANATAEASLVLVKGASYTSPRIVGYRSSTNRITFAPAAGETVTFTGNQFELGDDVASHAPRYVTIKGMVGAEFGAGTTCPDCRYGVFVKTGASQIELKGLKVGSVTIHGSTDILVAGSELGPCRARTVSNSSLAPSFSGCGNNKIDHFGAQPKRITFDNVLFHDYDFSSSCFSVANGGTNTAGQPDCHWESMFVNGVDGFTLRNSRFHDNFMVGVFFTLSGSSAALVGNRDILVENNVFGTGVNYGSGSGRYDTRGYGRWESVDFAWCTNAASGVYAYDNVIYRHNSGSRRAGFSMDPALCNTSKFRNVQVVGNVGLRNGCVSGVVYRSNVYSNTGTCDASERALGTGTLRMYQEDVHVPGPDSFRLASPSVADDLVPATFGCPATDRFGNPRGAGGSCDAGSHER